MNAMELERPGTVAERFDVIVVGGGQAGLSVGYHLAKRGFSFVILDAQDRIGDSWRQRWDSYSFRQWGKRRRGKHRRPVLIPMPITPMRENCSFRWRRLPARTAAQLRKRFLVVSIRE